MNRARRRGIENEQKGPSCLDRNVKIIGRALSTGLQETMTTEGGRGRFQGCPLNLRLSLSSLSLSRWKTRYRRTLSRTNERRYLARESSTVSQRGFSRKVSCIFQRLIPRNIPFHWGGGSHVANSSVIGEKSRPICWRDVLNDPWNCFYQSVRILTIFTAIFPSFFPT